jgi:PncC family amidohydrolase
MIELLSQKIKKKFAQTNYKLAVSESLTCGYIQKSIGQISGASNFFEGGITTYSIKQKCNLLNVDEAHASKVNCVSETVARQMAIGTCALFSTDVSVSTTGYAEPDIDNGIETPFAYVAISINGDIYCKKVEATQGMTRNKVQEYVTIEALEYLIECFDNVGY